MHKTLVALAVLTAVFSYSPVANAESATESSLSWTGNESEFTGDILENYNEIFVTVNTENGWQISDFNKNWGGKSLTITAESGVNHAIHTANEVKLVGLKEFIIDNKNTSNGHHGIFTEDTDGQFSVSSDTIKINAPQHGIYINNTTGNPHDITFKDFSSMTVTAGSSSYGSAIVVNHRGNVELSSEKENSKIFLSTKTNKYDHDGAIANKTSTDTTSDGQSIITLKASHIQLNEDDKNTGYNGIYSGEKSATIHDGTFIDSHVKLTSTDNKVYGAYFGIIQNGKGTVELEADNGGNLVKLTTTESQPYDPDAAEQIKSNALAASAIRVQGAENKKGSVLLNGRVNEINGAEGAGMAIYSSGLSEVKLTASDKNIVKGVIIAGTIPVETNALSSRNEKSAPEAVIGFEGDAALTSSFLAEHSYTNEQNETKTYQYVISAIALDRGGIQFKEGSRVDIRTEFTQTDKELRERAAWAYGGEFDLHGTELHVSTQQGVRFDNSVGIALVASDNGKLNATGLMTGSRIVGDIIGGANGTVDLSLSQGNGTYVRRDLDNTDADIFGNVLAGNGGKVNVELGKGVVWLGRADDYRDAGEEGQQWSGTHTNFFTPQFSDTVTSNGEVNITLNNGAIWGITGQSWVTVLAGTGGIIDLAGGTETQSHALRVWDVQGSHTFVLDLNDLEHAQSDMLYLKRQAETLSTNSEALVQTIVIENIQGLEQMAAGDKIRFATVDGGISFKTATVEGQADVVQIIDKGMINAGFVIGSEDYANRDETDNDYNGNDSKPDAVKPGQSWVDEKFENGQNWFLTRDPSKDTASNTAVNALDMAKANYRTAVYMDTLNKRQGEARFGTGKDQGLWARVRRDQINQVDSFHSSNIMGEIGYDFRRSSDSGVHHTGIAFDYMDGSIDYDGTDSSGDMKRWGLWLYNTWIGNDGQYTDVVFKWGRLSNDFNLKAQNSNEVISGGYDNDVFSISGEYGIKFAKDNGIYIEPQGQIQYSRVTSESYQTSQSSNLELDAIDSWIARIGARVGRTWNEQNRSVDLYVKADLLHEFDGEQRMRAVDSTGSIDWVYENNGTWTDFGMGFTYRTDDDSYAFCELEKMLGNHYGSSWQISAGMRLNF